MEKHDFRPGMPARLCKPGIYHEDVALLDDLLLLPVDGLRVLVQHQCRPSANQPSWGPERWLTEERLMSLAIAVNWSTTWLHAWWWRWSIGVSNGDPPSIASGTPAATQRVSRARIPASEIRDLGHNCFDEFTAAALIGEFILMELSKGCSLNNFLCERFGKERIKNLPQSLIIASNLRSALIAYPLAETTASSPRLCRGTDEANYLDWTA